MNRNLVKKVISNGGTLTPLIIPSSETNGTGLMNPSVYLDGEDLILNLRHVNYTLYHSEGGQIFQNRWGPLAYLNPENDIHLRTNNFYCVLDPNVFLINQYCKVDTSKLDIEPVWEFIGLEDARLVRWDNKLFMCGVRRDVKDNGEGRMELSEIIINNGNVEEINRYRIQPPNDPNSYCEKNWMPILDMPFHFVKWTNPTEVVVVDINTLTSKTIYQSTTYINLPDLRGSSQVIKYKDYRMCITHELNFFRNKLEQKDATYMHRFVIWDMDWNIIKITEPFSFMTGEIEFCCGMTLYKKDLLITFGFQDNAAYLLKVPKNMIDDIIGLKDDEFDWGLFETHPWFEPTKKQIFEENNYEKFFKVEPNDIVIDIGSSVGPFTYSILNRNPKRVYCLEPSKELFPTLIKNTKSDIVTCINKGISDKNGSDIFESLFNHNTSNTIPNENQESDSITFKTFIDSYNIEYIDFLKIDCEGGEYDIFNDENFDWIIQNVKKISGEFHLYGEQKEKFRKFRNKYLNFFTDFQIYSVDNVNIKWDLWNEHFIEYYCAVFISINNSLVNNEKWKSTNFPTLEITTSIPERGCIMNCVFCPQKTLTKSYSGERIMTLDNFKKVIDKLPKEITITFAGFTEPWLNKNCTDMLLYSYEKGHEVSVFTTGIGMNLEDVERMKDIIFSLGPNGGFTLHLPDNENLSHFPITKKYIDVLESIKTMGASKNNFHVVCMGTTHDKVKHIFPNAYVQEMWSRAGNLQKEQLLKPELFNLKDKYKSINHGDKLMTCNCVEKLYHSVILPNGDVSLCCMDYSLNHIIGNLYNQEYNDIIPKPNTPFELCKLCENGIKI